MDNTKESPTILSICTGIRGLERGIERVIGPVRIAAYVEIEAFACWNLVAAMESGILDPAPIWTDVKTFPSQHFSGKVHGIIGGYPCQPFSNAGNRKGEEDPRHLWPFIEQQISTIKPVWGFFENVAGHLTLGFESVKNSLEKMGYRVKAGIYSAEEVGAPHRRERLFILATLAHTDRKGLERGFGITDKSRPVCSKRMPTTGDGENMAYTNSSDTGRGDREISYQATTTEGKTQRENREWLRSISFNGSKTLPAPACHDGTEVQVQIRQSSIGWESISNGNQGRIDRFPSNPGEHQHEWEAPRTTQSGLGCTAHGYSFREDLLRALGNGVVEQTAELAFRDLIRKHFENGTEQNI